jgi:UDP-N-acetylmuramoyl-tripeptide--D-alanyl-D-alanine ligase
MIEAIISIGAALVFFKLFLFWLWLWQLKEYHAGRFLAHFQEGQAFKKIISSLWRLKYPKFTKKVTVIFFTGVFLALFIIVQGYYLFVFLLIILVPLFFQIPTLFWRNIYIEKARRKRMQFSNLLVIGITGSYGKTTTKEFLAHILSKKFKVLKTKEHQNSEVGVSNCILQELGPEHQVFVCEMGAYNRGGIKLLASIAKPRIGVLTGINQQHMATFGSQENIIQAKYELIESLPANGVAFFNAQNKYCVELYNKTSIKKVLYGQTASFRGEENLLGAMTVAKELGMTDEEIAGAVKEIEEPWPSFNMPSPYGDMAIKVARPTKAKQFAFIPGAKIQKGRDGFTVIESTYSANPDGVMAALEYLKKQPGKKILVMPCLIELGQTSREVHKTIGKKIEEVCDLAIITTRDRFDDIKEAAFAEASASQRELRIIYMETAKDIADTIKRTASSGDVVLLEGRVPQTLLSYLV